MINVEREYKRGIMISVEREYTINFPGSSSVRINQMRVVKQTKMADEERRIKTEWRYSMRGPS